jgi:acyl carrier protein
MTRTATTTKTKEELQDWLVYYISGVLFLEPDDIDIKTPFDRYGLDSSAAITLTGDLGDWLGGETLDPTLLWDYPTIESLTEFLLQQIPY